MDDPFPHSDFLWLFGPRFSLRTNAYFHVPRNHAGQHAKCTHAGSKKGVRVRQERIFGTKVQGRNKQKGQNLIF